MAEPTYRVCKTLSCNLDIQCAVLLGERTDIHPPQNSIRTWHTTNTLACALDYTHARTRRHLLSYTIHEANAYTQWPISRVHGDVLGVVLGAESSALKAGCVSMGSEVVPTDSLLL